MITIRSNKVRWVISGLLALLILFGTYRNVFSLAAFLIMGLMLVFCDKETNLLQIFFIMPLANIFKMSVDAQSFFTIVILAYVVLHMVLPRKATLIVMLFAFYIIIGQLFSGEFHLFRTIKLICNFLFLSSILNDKVSIKDKEVFFSYIIGNLVSSVFGLFDSSYFKIDNYIGAKEISSSVDGGVVARFTGLYVDPNYYAVGIIISLCLVVILFYKKELNGVFFVAMSISFIYFLILTYSKSAVIMLILPFVLLIYMFYKEKKYFAIIASIFLVIVVVMLVFTGWVDAFDIVIERFTKSETADGVDINTLTTGRFDLWLMYSEYLIKNIDIGFFGGGIAFSLLEGVAAHNTYIDLFYYLGVFGGLLLLAILFTISEQSRKIDFKRNIMNYSVIICIVIMYFFLSELFYFDPPFHIYLAIIVLNTPMGITKNDNGYKENQPRYSVV
ncbi:MAG: hypothetical protein IKB88_10390 [Clostridia bacterium]|nr:hypothetical protein [Clostridia bacterium]